MDSPFTMIVLIVAIVTLAGVAKHYFESRKPQAIDPADEARIKRIEARLAALEAVVADGDHALKQKFAELERGEV